MRIDELRDLTRAELLERAKELEIPNRGSMTKEDLVQSIKKVGAKARPKAARKTAAAETTTAVEAAPPKARAPRKAPARAAAGSKDEVVVAPPAPVAEAAPPPPAPSAPPSASPMAPREEGRRFEASRPTPSRRTHDDNEDEDGGVDPWNSTALGRDPNYGRFLADKSALSPVQRGRRPGGRNERNDRPDRGAGPGRRPMGPGHPQSESLIDRSERGRERAVERSQMGRGGRQEFRRDGRPSRRDRDGRNPRSDRAREELRDSGQARRGSGYVPQFDGSRGGQRDQGRDPRREGGRDRGREERGPDRRNDRGPERGNDRGPDRAREFRGVQEASAAAPATQDWGRGSRRDHGRRQDVRGPSAGPGGERFDRGGVPTGARGEQELPERYGEDRVSLLARDPYWLYAWWEITETALSRVQEQMGSDFEGARGVLRVFRSPLPNAAGQSESPTHTDITLDDEATSWYIHADAPEHEFRVEIGVAASSGRFYPLAASNSVVTPADSEGGEVPEGAWSEVPPPVDAAPVASPRGEAREQRSDRGAPAPGTAKAMPPAAARATLEQPAEFRGDWEGPPSASHAANPDDWPAATPEAVSDAAASGEASATTGERAESSEPQRGRSGRTLPPSVRVIRDSDPAEEQRSAMAPGQSRKAPSSPASWAQGAAPARVDEHPAGRGHAPGARATVAPAAERAFWFALNTELVIYGATEPDATVTLQGKPIPLRPDGTFTIRFALPDGELTLPAIAVSRDGGSERVVTPVVRRSTTSHAKEQDRSKSE